MDNARRSHPGILTVSATVSVIVPAYNRAALIGETLECLLRQTLPPHELFVVDDGSTDDTVSTVRHFGDRITLIQQPNAGPGAARNTALARATGDFIQFFDSDDLCTADKLAAQAAALEFSGADIAYGPWIKARLEHGKAFYDGLVYQQDALAGEPLEAFLQTWVCFIPCCLIRRSLVVQLGGYPTHAHTAEDLELLARAILAGARFVHAQGGLVLVRQHPENQISASSAGAATRLREVAQYFAIVDGLLAAHRPKPSFGARRAWALSGWSARREAGLVPNGWAMSALLRVRQIRAGVRQRLGGSRMANSYMPRRLQPSQAAGIRALGYEPVAM